MNSRRKRCFNGESRWGRHFSPRADLRRIGRAFFFMAACWLFWSVPNLLALNQENMEYSVKLAFLYNFTKFIEWPSGSYRDPGAPLVICIIGHDPFSAEVEGELLSRKVAGHPVEFRTLRSSDTMSACQVVFIPDTEKSQIDGIMKALKGLSTLTVGETEGFAVLGGMINLTVEEKKVHFEINQLAAERAGLKVSSKLLSIARVVRE
jgi:YfiR/HmsC-like